MKTIFVCGVKFNLLWEPKIEGEHAACWLVFSSGRLIGKVPSFYGDVDFYKFLPVVIEASDLVEVS